MYASKDEIVEDECCIYPRFTYLKKELCATMNYFNLNFEKPIHEKSVYNITLPDTILALKIR